MNFTTLSVIVINPSIHHTLSLIEKCANPYIRQSAACRENCEQWMLLVCRLTLFVQTFHSQNEAIKLLRKIDKDQELSKSYKTFSPCILVFIVLFFDMIMASRKYRAARAAALYRYITNYIHSILFSEKLDWLLFSCNVREYVICASCWCVSNDKHM